MEPGCAASTDIKTEARRLNRTLTEEAKTRKVIQQESRNRLNLRLALSCLRDLCKTTGCRTDMDPAFMLLDKL